MPLDPSIILGVQQPQIQNPMDSMVKAMTFKNLAMRSQTEGLQNQQAQQEFNDNQSMRNAYSNNTTVGPDGTPALNRQGVLKDLAQSNPSVVPKVAQQFQSMDMDMQNQKLTHAAKQMEIAGQISSPAVVTDQKSLDNMRATAQSLGLPVDQIPTVYDPRETPTQLASLQQRAMSAHDQITTQLEQQKVEVSKQQAINEGKKLDIENYKTFGSPLKPGQGGQPAAQTNDPATLVPRHVPPDRQAKALDEIDAAQNTAKNAPKILESFDKAAANLHAADLVPGASNADQKSLHALMGPTFKDVEGTVRQAAMDNMNNNTTPQFGDNANTIATKRAALVGYLQSKASAPTAKAFGIDLTKYPTTSISKDVLNGTYKNKSPAIHPALDGMSLADLQALKAQKEQANGK